MASGIFYLVADGIIIVNTFIVAFIIIIVGHSFDYWWQKRAS